MPVSLPNTVTSLGNKAVVFLRTTPANPLAWTKAELNAGLFAQCHIYGTLSPQPTQSTGAAPSKICTKIDDQRLGRITYEGFDVQYSYIPQLAATPGSAGNELYELLVPGTFGWIAILDGIDGQATSALATNDVINNGFKVQIGEYREGQTGDGEFDEFAVTQTLVPRGGRLLHNYKTPST